MLKPSSIEAFMVRCYKRNQLGYHKIGIYNSRVSRPVRLNDGDVVKVQPARGI